MKAVDLRQQYAFIASREGRPDNLSVIGNSQAAVAAR
jgi:hypothetical protein